MKKTPCGKPQNEIEAWREKMFANIEGKLR
jgi:hypothetical protein